MVKTTRMDCNLIREWMKLLPIEITVDAAIDRFRREFGEPTPSVRANIFNISNAMKNEKHE
jgi:hypothetical protein